MCFYVVKKGSLLGKEEFKIRTKPLNYEGYSWHKVAATNKMACSLVNY